MRRLTALNLLLLLLTAAGIWRLVHHAQQRETRQRGVLARQVQPAPAPVIVLPEPPPPVRPMDYLEVAQQLPFHPERNPEVVVAPPEVKPMPALPRYYGLMNFGAGPRVVLAVAPGQPQKSYQPGDRIGDFRLQAISPQGLTFEWEGKLVNTAYAAIRDNTPPPDAAPAAAPAADAAKAAPKSVSAQAARGPGADIGGNFKACVAGDDSPPGTVSGGYRKLVSETPFGKACRWEKVQ